MSSSQGKKGYTPWSANRKAKQASNWSAANARRKARSAAQAAAEERNRALGDGELTPWQKSKAIRKAARLAARGLVR